MAIGREIQYMGLDDLKLDPINPRLGRGNARPDLRQSKILELMKDWSLEELAISFVESGFWPHEALIVIQEPLYGRNAFVVIEGNRRLAALKFLKRAVDGEAVDKKWNEMIEEKRPGQRLFDRIPFIQVDSRKDVEAFLGFRHVTGIKEWKPAEKAEYISKLIEDSGMSYVEVMRKIGSRTKTVRQNYISYRLLLQMEDQADISIQDVEQRFSVLFLSLRTEGVKTYLNIDMEAEAGRVKRPVPRTHVKNLINFALWLFGSGDRPALVSDSRQVDQFGRILQSQNALKYLERTEIPSFEIAFQLAGGDEPELIRLLEIASDNIQMVLGRAHHYQKSKKMKGAAKRLGEDTLQLLKLYPGMTDDLLLEAEK